MDVRGAQILIWMMLMFYYTHLLGFLLEWWPTYCHEISRKVLEECMLEEPKNKVEEEESLGKLVETQVHTQKLENMVGRGSRG